MLLFLSLAALAGPDTADLSVKLGRRSMRVQSALSYTHGEQARTFVLSSQPLTCDDLLDAGARPSPKETRLRLTVAPQRSTSGTTWALTRLVHLPRSMQPKGTLDTDGGLTLSLEVHHEEPADAFLEIPAITYALSGTMTAEDCGAQPVDPGAAARPQDDLVVSIAGQPVPMQGATRTQDRLLLTSQPHGCGATVSDADVVVEVRLKDSPPVADMVVVRGQTLPVQYTAGFGPTWGNQLDVQASGSGRLGLEGSFDMLGSPVTLSGTADALVCP